VVGSYLTPRSGEHAGQLGPWSRLVLAVATLWYLVPGTVIAGAVLVLLLTPPVRRVLGSG